MIVVVAFVVVEAMLPGVVVLPVFALLVVIYVADAVVFFYVWLEDVASYISYPVRQVWTEEALVDIEGCK